ncbi:hypothetical protein L6452_13971 [Arctium lappa]|uniref:Uncharacterized protein n=1 Tax=Arctium lappa TaxID=4217 RepID=A0ACB9CJS8_ARCLA|nr:hypothetical protein L6452_13971 [Arctium lappa]
MCITMTSSYVRSNSTTESSGTVHQHYRFKQQEEDDAEQKNSSPSLDKQLLCGRPAVDFTLDEKQHSLAAWAKHCVEEGTIHQFVDPCLRGEVSTRCLKKFSQLAYKCLLWSPKDRPTMTEVVARLEFVLVLTLQKYSRVTIVEKVRSLFTVKLPVPSNPKKKAIKKEEQPTTVAEGGSHHGDNTTSRDPVHLKAHIVTPNLKMYTYAELRSATKNFQPSTILGGGGFGDVFKGWVDGVTYAPTKDGVGIPVAIKKSNSNSCQGLEEWQTAGSGADWRTECDGEGQEEEEEEGEGTGVGGQEAEVKFLGKFSHPNLVKLLGYCQKKKKFLLVYEFMQKGSLEGHLFKRGKLPKLSWDTRIKIAMGVAQGLVFLHASESKVIFRDVKSSNILLDGEFNAKLSDFGLAMLGPIDGESHVTTMVKGTYGYAAPEYISTGQIYVKSDVYGFGVVLLEMITGLPVLDTNRPGSQQNLVEWTTPFLTNTKKLLRIMDIRMEQAYPLKGAIKAARLVRKCLLPDPNHRPSMEEVLTNLEEINAINM